MSKGSKRITVRVPGPIVDRMQSIIDAHMSNPDRQEDMSVSDLVLTAIVERLAKIQRGRREKGNLQVYKAEPGYARELVDTFPIEVWGE